jgi:threonine/homoserine/homoserine lactone efflux protein
MTEFITVVLLHMFAVMSPGPDFFLITRQSLRYGRQVAIWSALGIGSGILVHSLMAITGILLLITSNEYFLSLLKITCSAYLLYLGSFSILKASTFDQIEMPESKWANANGFIVGLMTNLTNVKALLFFVTLFGVVLNSDNKSNLIVYGIYMSLATFIWFAFVGYVFTNQNIKRKFAYFFRYFEKFLGVILVIIAVQILLSIFIK